MMTSLPGLTGIYGQLPRPLEAYADLPKDSVHLSPLEPGARLIDTLETASFSRLALLAPRGTQERSFALAHALRALQPGGQLIAMAPKDKGGHRLGKELTALGCAVYETAKAHHRICQTERPADLSAIEAACQTGGLQQPPALAGLWSQPGVFSWDRPDSGTETLLAVLPDLKGRGADFGCGIGLISQALLAQAGITRLFGLDIDGRAIRAAQKNLSDPRLSLHWHDVRHPLEGLADLDFVVMNPPFHDGPDEDKQLGQAFIRVASERLRPGGVCWLVANRHLPYEAELKSRFAHGRLVFEANGFKVYEAIR